MKKLLAAILFAVMAEAMLPAQSTTAVTATVTDSDGTAWANGLCTALYAPVANYGPQMTNIATGKPISPNPATCTLNGSGQLSITLTQTKYVYGPVVSAAPSPGVIFSVCPEIAAAPSYATAPIAIMGSSQDVSAQINAAIVAPRVQGFSPLAQAYNDTEVAATNGNSYVRLSDGTTRCYTTGTGWAACGNPGTITGVTAGAGLSGGGSTGAVSLAVVHPVVPGTITLSAATADTATVAGAGSTSTCVLFASNSTATGATIVPYVSAVATNAVTVTHAATVGTGATYNILCTVD